jgi:hypothetical protein
MMGGDTILIHGEGFPSSLDDGSDLTVELSDGTRCPVIEVSSALITCVTERLSEDSLGQDLWIIITLNGLFQEPATLTAASFYNTVGSIEPPSYSPVLKTNLTIYMDENFDDTLEIDDLRVNLI